MREWHRVRGCYRRAAQRTFRSIGQEQTRPVREALLVQVEDETTRLKFALQVPIAAALRRAYRTIELSSNHRAQRVRRDRDAQLALL